MAEVMIIITSEAIIKKRFSGKLRFWLFVAVGLVGLFFLLIVYFTLAPLLKNERGGALIILNSFSAFP
jgi:hypothetical protein